MLELDKAMQQFEQRERKKTELIKKIQVLEGLEPPPQATLSFPEFEDEPNPYEQESSEDEDGNKKVSF